MKSGTETTHEWGTEASVLAKADELGEWIETTSQMMAHGHIDPDVTKPVYELMKLAGSLEMQTRKLLTGRAGRV